MFFSVVLLSQEQKFVHKLVKTGNLGGVYIQQKIRVSFEIC